MANVFRIRPVLAGALLTTACTVQQTEIPMLTGPSEFALSLSIEATPDTIRQDGVDRSTVMVTARDASGAPRGSLPLRLDILVDAGTADFGTLSSRTVTTGSDGRAHVTYTAPPPPPINAPLGTCLTNNSVLMLGPCVRISATPVGSNFTGSQAQTVLIHLVPPSVILPASDPNAPTATFVFTPTSPRVNQLVLFNAQASTAVPGRRIVEYSWTWGDGESSTRSVPTEDHDYIAPGLYPVTLTVVDDAGLQGMAGALILVSP
jgi:PKD repeat protein